MKWVFCGFLWACASAAALRADQAGDLFTQASGDFSRSNYQDAAPLFDQIINNYPTMSNIDEVRLEAGLCYLYLGDFDKAIDRLSKETGPPSPAANHGPALYYTGYAQLLKGGKATDATQKKAAFAQAITTLSQMLTLMGAATSQDERDYLELGYYNRALAYLYSDNLTAAEKDVNVLLQQFSGSLQKPDYLLLLGNLYAGEAAEADRDKKPDATIRAAAEKGIAAFDQAIADPNALIQANDARLAKAEVLYLLASLTPTDQAGYQKALDAFREVGRKADLISRQQANVTALQAQSQAQLQGAAGGATTATARTRIIEREKSRLATLKDEPDPIVQALIRIAECYNSLNEGNEARTVLHRLAKAGLTSTQQKDVDFALLYSYVLSGQTAKSVSSLNDFLAKYPADIQASGISIQIGNQLLKAGDGNGALAQAELNLKDYPTGAYFADAIQLKVAALTKLNRLAEAEKTSNDFLKKNPNSPAAIGIILSGAQRQAAEGDLPGALASYQKVRDTGATPEIRAAGAGGYIQTLQAMGKTDDVIRQSKTFAATFPTSPILPNILIMGAVAQSQKNDPGAIAALQDIARRYPADTPNAPGAFALFYVVNIYQHLGQDAQLIQAADALKKAYPTQYTYLQPAADLVSAVYLKEKKFDLAAAEYQPLVRSAPPEVAALAQAKLGQVALASAKAMGPYQSMQDAAEKAQAEKKLATAEQDFITVLRNYPEQLPALNEAFKGLDDALLQRRAWGLLKQGDFADYLAKETAGLTDPGVAAHVELAKDGLVFLDKDGVKDYPAALTRFQSALGAHPITLTRTEATRYGELLLASKDYPVALQTYQGLLAGGSKDPQLLADAYYGMGAVYFAQGDLAQARDYFTKMKALPGGAAWNPHILDVDYGLALAAEKSGDTAAAKAAYGELIQAPQAAVQLQAQATLGYGRMLAVEGHTIAPPQPNSIEFAVHYFEQVDTLYGPAVPEQSAEGLFDAGQAYQKVGKKAEATKEYNRLIFNYSTSAPDWAAKAKAALAAP